MTALVTISVLDFTGFPFAVSAEDGLRLHERIAPLMAADAPVALSFAGIDVLSGAFLGASIGPFCDDYSEAELARLLAVCGLSADNGASVKLCMKNARRYNADRAAYNAAWSEEFGDDCSSVQ